MDQDGINLSLADREDRKRLRDGKIEYSGTVTPYRHCGGDPRIGERKDSATYSTRLDV